MSQSPESHKNEEQQDKEEEEVPHDYLNQLDELVNILQSVDKLCLMCGI